MLLFLVGIAVVVLGTLRIVKGPGFLDLHPEEQLSVYELWNNRYYDDIIARCEETLQSNPLDGEALVLKGFSLFYKAVSEISLEDRIPIYDEAIVALRRAKLTGDIRYEGEIDYILGKTYYHKGRYYFDLAARYIELSVEKGYRGDDTYEYLGIAYTKLGDLEQGIYWLEKAIDDNASDLVALTIAKNYLLLENLGESEEYFYQAIEYTTDIAVEKTSRLSLGEMYFGKNEYDKAEEQYQKVLEIDSESADAHYFLGEVYLSQGDRIRARAEWREALRIDPSHYAAKLRYY